METIAPFSKVYACKSTRAGRNAGVVHFAYNRAHPVPFCGKLQRTATTATDETATCRDCIQIAHERFLDVEGLVRISPRVRDLIAAVRAHAVENYNTGAWDIIVEAYSDSELAQTIGKCRTAAGAIRKVAGIVELYTERRAPHDAEIAAATEPVVQPEPTPEYDRFAEGRHPDGSEVRWHHDPIGGESWAYRYWDAKVGNGSITVEQRHPDGDYVTVENYNPGWVGDTLYSPNYCDGLPF